MTDAPRAPSQGDSDGNPHIQLIMAMVFLAVVGGGAIDLVLDRPETLLSGHVIFELGMIGVSLGAAGYLGTRWYQANKFARQLTLTVEASQAERDAWRRRAQRVLDGLGKVMSAQFESWGLTPTERETALMLLQGHSHKRIGKLTGRSDRTIRQHAVSVYRKSGLAGRAELAGFFLGDLVLPESDPDADPA